MKKNSTNSMGSRLGKAKDVLSQIKSYDDFSPAETDLTADEFGALITRVDLQDADTATKQEEYSKAVELRQKRFFTDDDSLNVITDQVSSIVKSSPGGEKSKDAVTISAMAAIVRGISVRKKKNQKPGSGETTENSTGAGTESPTPRSVSRGDQTFGNMSKVFDNIIATLQSFGARYKGSGQFSIEMLKAKSAELHELNNQVATTRIRLQEARNARTKLYTQLSQTFKRLKYAVKGDYTAKSPKYKALIGIYI